MQKKRPKTEEKLIYEPDLDSPRGKGKFYNLMMFPYLSAEGLHVGNMYAFVGADIYGRKKRMEGFDVFEPIGLDGFGIHSENYALKIGKHPKKLAALTQKHFYKQLESIGNGFAWDERLETYDPAYYRWTQWIFVQMFKKGLAYRKKAKVNWCPKCLTVLADEQVLAPARRPALRRRLRQGESLGEGGGECERCGTMVIKKELEQWFFKITDYAERLLNDLEKIDWSENVKIAQKNWIGRSEGALISFDLKFKNENLKISETIKFIEVFTTRPDTLFGATYIAISPELAKSWLDSGWQAPADVGAFIGECLKAREVPQTDEEPSFAEATAGKEKTGIFTGVYALNPANQEKIPVWVANYVLAGYGTGAIMAVPAHDRRDFEFAKKYGLPIKIVICPHYPEKTCPMLDAAYEGEGHLVGSGEFDGVPSEEAKRKIAEKIGATIKVNYHLRDWLISRQRYWGPPIPMIFCGPPVGGCGWQPVPEEDLPVLLPDVKDFHPTGTDQSPLATVESFVKTKCPKCGGEARRETDVSDTFLDSAWYFFRYPDVKNKKEPFGKLGAKTWLPVDMYIGGAEHAVLHLLYTRFITKVFHDWGLVDFDEPFKKFRAHGLLIKDGAKMSKSKGNVVNPDDYIKKYGADVFRMYLMFLGPFEQGGDFRDEGIAGIARFLERVKKLAKKEWGASADETILHRSVKKISDDIEGLHYNTAIAQLMMLLSALEKMECDRASVKVFLKLLAPFAPFIAEGLWHKLGEKESVHRAEWPTYDESKTRSATATIVVQINGKVRDRFEAETGTGDVELKAKALELPKIKKLIGGKAPANIIVIKDRLVNIVL
ncbi:MAG: leucine--tRNA ligase [Candidatus Niyogibacteria bacterium]|nr:leucine--tRNA ligase [Candidatus Niyogibacteria bacterium]